VEMTVELVVSNKIGDHDAAGLTNLPPAH
jgi:hypothetical protein